MLGADAACLGVNSLVQETTYVSSNKERAGEHSIVSVPFISSGRFVLQACVVSIKMSSKMLHFILKVSVNRAAFEQIHTGSDAGI